MTQLCLPSCPGSTRSLLGPIQWWPMEGKLHAYHRALSVSHLQNVKSYFYIHHSIVWWNLITKPWCCENANVLVYKVKLNDKIIGVFLCNKWLSYNDIILVNRYIYVPVPIIDILFGTKLWSGPRRDLEVKNSAT